MVSHVKPLPFYELLQVDGSVSILVLAIEI